MLGLLRPMGRDALGGRTSPVLPFAPLPDLKLPCDLVAYLDQMILPVKWVVLSKIDDCHSASFFIEAHREKKSGNAALQTNAGNARGAAQKKRTAGLTPPCEGVLNASIRFGRPSAAPSAF